MKPAISSGTGLVTSALDELFALISSRHCCEKNVDSPQRAQSTHRNRKYLADMPDRKWSAVCTILDAERGVDAQEESIVSLSSRTCGNWRLNFTSAAL